MSDRPPASGDEDVLVIPESWRSRLHPRRGGVPGPPVELDRSAPARFAEQVDRVRPEIARLLTGNRSDDVIVKAMRAHLEGQADPLGAAAVAAVVEQATKLASGTVANMVADAWLIDGGTAFAACAFAELARVQVVTGTSVRFLSDGQSPSPWWRPGAARVRALLAAAEDGEYEEAVHRLAEHRDSQAQRLLTAFLVPTRRDWFEVVETSPGSDLRWMIWCSLDDPGQLERLVRKQKIIQRVDRKWDVLTTAAEGIGTALVPPLVQRLSAGDLYEDAEYVLLLEILAAMPDDESFNALVDHAHQERDRLVLPVLGKAMERFPRRAVRLLAPHIGADPLVDELLTGHLRAHPELVESDLPDVVAEDVRTLAKRLHRVPEAGDLPPLLVEPPWTRRRKARRPVVIKGLAAPVVRAVVWAPGEREEWLPEPSDQTAERPEPDIREALYGPEEHVRPRLAQWRPETDDAAWLCRQLLARFEFDALHIVLDFAQKSPISCGKLLVPFLDAQVAVLMAERFSRTTASRQIAAGWLLRHGTAAVELLVPDALGEAGPRRRRSEAALRHLASRHGRRDVVAAAGSHGAEAADAIDAMLATDPLDLLPARVPKVGEWAAPARLPQVLLRDRDHALPETAVGHVLTMLAMSKPGEVYAGVETVRDVCDPVSLAQFGWALFQRWRMDGEDPKKAWAMQQLAWTGDDHTVREFAGVLKQWVAKGPPSRVAKGLDMLASFETDVALTHLHWIAEGGRRRSVRARAREKIDALAGNLGLTSDQLADRVVPDFGLDAQGSMVLDYGPRRFTVGFDERLQPFVFDAEGKPRKLVPRPVKADDQHLAKASHQRFSALKKEVAKIAAGEIDRLRAAMLRSRTWEPDEFRRHLVGHPLLWHIVRRLVWLCDGEAFRLAEDRTFADVNDATLTPSEGARIRVAHPVLLGDRLPAWVEIFDDYEIMQPFDQLDRPWHVPAEEERAGRSLGRFDGATISGSWRGEWTTLGWMAEVSGNTLSGIACEVAPGVLLKADLGVPQNGALTVRSVRLHGRDVPPLSEMNPVALSEAIAGLVRMTSGEPPHE
ncbi:DUF4132 domain-containing protein [Actinomadura vinacea]